MDGGGPKIRISHDPVERIRPVLSVDRPSAVVRIADFVNRTGNQAAARLAKVFKKKRISRAKKLRRHVIKTVAKGALSGAAHGARTASPHYSRIRTSDRGRKAVRDARAAAARAHVGRFFTHDPTFVRFPGLSHRRQIFLSDQLVRVDEKYKAAVIDADTERDQRDIDRLDFVEKAATIKPLTRLRKAREAVIATLQADKVNADTVFNKAKTAFSDAEKKYRQARTRNPWWTWWKVWRWPRRYRSWQQYRDEKTIFELAEETHAAEMKRLKKETSRGLFGINFLWMGGNRLRDAARGGRDSYSAQYTALQAKFKAADAAHKRNIATTMRDAKRQHARTNNRVNKIRKMAKHRHRKNLWHDFKTHSNNIGNAVASTHHNIVGLAASAPVSVVRAAATGTIHALSGAFTGAWKKACNDYRTVKRNHAAAATRNSVARTTARRHGGPRAVPTPIPTP